MDFQKYIDKTFLSPEELIDSSSKTKSLNALKYRVDTLSTNVTDSKLTAKLVSIYSLLEDAYKIDMYKFQFKVFILSITKEIKSIEDFILKIVQG